MQYARFAVDTRPYCVWDPELAKTELRHLDRIDPSYFTYLARVYSGISETDRPDEDSDSPTDDDGPDAQHAALGLRAAYLHATETFLALMFASIQAPQCTFGWMNLYQTGDLRSLARKIDRHELIYSHIVSDSLTWEQLAEVIFSHAAFDSPEKAEWVIRRFSQFWRHVANTYVRKETADEYNSIKHGLRLASGGFRFAIGLESKAGLKDSPARMRTLANHDYGASYLRLRELPGKRNFGVKTHSAGWSPEESYAGLHLLSFSIENLKSHLKLAVHGIEEGSQFVWPDSDLPFDTVLQTQRGMSSMSTNSVVLESEIRTFSDAEILDTYRSQNVK